MEPNHPSMSPGTIVGDRYRVEGVIGQGGFGAIYEATDMQQGERVALKVLHANFATGKTDAKRFRREAALVKNLHHENVVRLLDFGETDRGVPFIAFELLRGVGLDAAIAQWGPMPLERVGKIAREMLRALGAAHLLGIVHRDIKPANVFLCDAQGGAPAVKVLDFGVAKAMTPEGPGQTAQTELTRDGHMVGTPFYMAPEQVRATNVGPQTDLYAVGLVMAELITGCRVIEGDSLITVYMAQIAEEPIAFPTTVTSSPWGPIIAKACEKSLERRYRSAREMCIDIEQALGRHFGLPKVRQPDTTGITAVMADKRQPAETITTVRARPMAQRAPEPGPGVAPTRPMEVMDALAAVGGIRPGGPDESAAQGASAGSAPSPGGQPANYGSALGVADGPASNPRVSRYGTVVMSAAEPPADPSAMQASGMMPVAAPAAPFPGTGPPSALLPVAAPASGRFGAAAQVPMAGAAGVGQGPPGVMPALGPAAFAPAPPLGQRAPENGPLAEGPGPAAGSRSKLLLIVIGIVVALGLGALVAVALAQ